MTDKSYDVLGIGNAIVDVLTQVDDGWLEERGIPRGSMQLIDADQAAELYAACGESVQCSGGSAANTMVGLASFGSRAAYIGKVGEDEPGRIFARDIAAAQVAFDTPPLAGGATARCLIYVTPDAQRTMMTFLGASSQLAPEDIEEQLVRSARVTYLEGYLFDPPPARAAFERAAEIAHASGGQVALSLSDSFCVERHRGEFRALVADHVDLLFANETEIVSLYQARDVAEAAAAVAGQCELAALTLGEKGALVVGPQVRVEVPAAPVAHVVDTTGAGDLFAAGFLHGIASGADPARSARLGALAAAEIISHFGARPETPLAGLG